ncbi:hypothetical protein pb186bvf_020270 [Paramecium bursaria]
MISKFHTAPYATQDDINDMHEEFQQLKQNYEAMCLTSTDKIKMNQYRQEYQEMKVKYAQYCPPRHNALNMLVQQNEKLVEYTKTAYDAEGTANHIQLELKHQTNKLEKIVNKNKLTQQELNESERLVNQMKTRSIVMKIITIGIILIILIGIGVIIYVKFFQ